ncbi:MAG: nucleotidyltransferase substrate binding protein [Saprospiraceae bacterium]
MENKDIRWIQRFQNYRKALEHLREAVALSKTRLLSNLESQGLIQGFEFTHELAWKTMKDFLEDKGISNLIGSKDSTRNAFREGLITDGEGWMEMIKSRNLTSHTYNEEVAEGITKDILELYFDLFETFEQKMEQLRAREQGSFSK